MKMENEITEFRKKMEELERRILALEKTTEKESKITEQKKRGTKTLLLGLKDEGFFNVERTISQIRDALHAKGKIVELTDLPPYLLKLVRTDALKRAKKEIAKKKMWVYFA
ncbi:MAG: hypothetical protein QXM22_01150 [Candidatus Bathyarchaeia archaeon]